MLLHAEVSAAAPVSRWLRTYLQAALPDLGVLRKPLLRLSSVLFCVGCIIVISSTAIILQPVRPVRSLVVALCQLPAGARVDCLPAAQGQGNDIKGISQLSGKDTSSIRQQLEEGQGGGCHTCHCRTLVHSTLHKRSSSSWHAPLNDCTQRSRVGSYT